MNKVSALGNVGRYFVISEDDFFEELPKDIKRDEAELKKAIKGLAADGYIDLKYASGNMYCVALLKEYVPPVQPEEQKSDEQKPEPEVKDADGEFEEDLNEPAPFRSQFMYTFWAALAGGAIGSAIIALIGLIF